MSLDKVRTPEEISAQGQRLLYAFSYEIWRPPLSKEAQDLLPPWERYTFADHWPSIASAPCVALDYETQSVTDNLKDAVDPRRNEIVSIAVSFREGDFVKNLYIPLRHNLYKFNWPNAREVVERLFTLPQLKVFHNADFEYSTSMTEGFDEKVGEICGVRPVWPFADTSVMAWLYDENLRPKLKVLAEALLGWKSSELRNLFKKEKIGCFGVDAVAPYACQDSYITLLLYEFFMENFTPGQKQLYDKLEQPITRLLCEARMEGIGIDLSLLQQFERRIGEKYNELKLRIEECLSISNASSTAQVLSAVRSRGYALPSTSKDRLRKWLSIHSHRLDENTRKGLEALAPFRYMKTYLKTYLHGEKGIVPNLWPDGRIRPKAFQWSVEEGSRTGKQRGTISGRFSYSAPSFNTFIKEPKEEDLAAFMKAEMPDISLRRLVVSPDPDEVVLCGDLSQIEMRTTASCTQDQKLLDFFNNKIGNADLYSTMAASACRLSLDQCGKGSIYRQLGKLLVLATNYGAGAKNLASKIWPYAIKILFPDGAASEEEAEKKIVAYARELIVNLKREYTGLSSYQSRMEAAVLGSGGVLTSRLGRSRRVPGYVKGNHRALRQFCNFLPQSYAVDICKLAMLQFEKESKERGIRARIVANIHDEIVIFCHRRDVFIAGKLLEECFLAQQWVLEPRCKIEFSLSYGRNWYDQVEFSTADAQGVGMALPGIQSNRYDGDTVFQRIEEIVREAKGCQKCEVFSQFGWKKVYLEGSVIEQPRLVVVGANPGQTEIQKNRPFVGRAGQIFRGCASKARLRLDDAVIINSLFCFSPATEGITNTHISNCRTYTQEILELLRPEVVLCLGSIAMRSVLGKRTSAVELGWHITHLPYRVYVANHPSFIDRDPAEEPRFISCLREVATYLDQSEDSDYCPF